jgi:hypothetical protein
MASTEGKVVIGAAVITAIGGVVAAIIGTHHSPPGPSTGTTTTTAAVAATGSIVISDPHSPGAWVYSAPTSDSSTHHLGGIESGASVEIICSQPGPMAGDTDSNQSTIWFKIRYRGGYGFVPSAEVPGASGSVPTC